MISPVLVREGVGSVIEGDHGPGHPFFIGVLPSILVEILEHLSDDRPQVEQRVEHHLDPDRILVRYQAGSTDVTRKGAVGVTPRFGPRSHHQLITQ